MKTIRQRFQAEDGREFDTQAEAERYETMCAARDAFKQAERVYGERLAETEKTADGHPFSWDRWEYWHVAPGWRTRPSLARVSFYRWSIQWREEREGLVLVEPQEKDRPREYRIRDLYASEKAARAAWLQQSEAWLAEQAAEIEKLREGE